MSSYQELKFEDKFGVIFILLMFPVFFLGWFLWSDWFPEKLHCKEVSFEQGFKWPSGYTIVYKGVNIRSGDYKTVLLCDEKYND
jgi:hypothetical protein